jgi:hypothetical protein
MECIRRAITLTTESAAIVRVPQFVLPQQFETLQNRMFLIGDCRELVRLAYAPQNPSDKFPQAINQIAGEWPSGWLRSPTDKTLNSRSYGSGRSAK